MKRLILGLIPVLVLCWASQAAAQVTQAQADAAKAACDAAIAECFAAVQAKDQAKGLMDSRIEMAEANVMDYVLIEVRPNGAAVSTATTNGDGYETEGLNYVADGTAKYNLAGSVWGAANDWYRRGWWAAAKHGYELATEEYNAGNVKMHAAKESFNNAKPYFAEVTDLIYADAVLYKSVHMDPMRALCVTARTNHDNNFAACEVVRNELFDAIWEYGSTFGWYTDECLLATDLYYEVYARAQGSNNWRWEIIAEQASAQEQQDAGNYNLTDIYKLHYGAAWWNFHQARDKYSSAREQHDDIDDDWYQHKLDFEAIFAILGL